MYLPSDLILLMVLLGQCCQPLIVGGVEVKQLPQRVQLGIPLEIVCRAEQRAGPSVVLFWRWIANGVVVNLEPYRLPPDIFFDLSSQVSGLEDLIQFLQSGKRMERPELMPRAIGNVMADFWKHNEEERTTFGQLEQIFHKAVDPIIRQRFAGPAVTEEKNNYVKMNKEIRSNNPEAKFEYETMASNENRQVVSLSNASTSSQYPNAPRKLYPQLSVSTEIDTLPQPPLSFQKSLADNSTQDYLDVLPNSQV